MWIYRAPLLCVDVTSDLMDEKTEECLFTHVPSGQHAVSHSPIPDSSKIQLHLKEEIGLKNLSIYVISTLSICVNLTIWFPHHKRFFFFFPATTPAIFFLYLFSYPSVYLPYHTAKPSIYTSICLSDNILVSICPTIFSVYSPHCQSKLFPNYAVFFSLEIVDLVKLVLADFWFMRPPPSICIITADTLLFKFTCYGYITFSFMHKMYVGTWVTVQENQPWLAFNRSPSKCSFHWQARALLGHYQSWRISMVIWGLAHMILMD